MGRASLLLVLSALWRCERLDTRGPAAPPVVVADSTRFLVEWRTVLPASQGYAVLRQCSRPAPDSAAVTGFWVPTEAELTVADSLIAERVQTERNGRSPGRAGPTASMYRRQYIGLQLGERRVIYANLFVGSDRVRGDTGDTWRHDPVLACDGGDGFIGAEIVPESRSLVSFEMNGPG